MPIPSVAVPASHSRRTTSRGAGQQGIDWTWLALDKAMGKAPLGGGETGRYPTDRGKRGVKRSVLTDGRGGPLGAAIDGANHNDRKLMRGTLEAIPVKRPRPTRQRPQQPCLDRGFDYDEAHALAAQVRRHAAPAHPRRGSSGPSVMSEPGRGAGWWSARTRGCTGPARS
jgi:putative transposase